MKKKIVIFGGSGFLGRALAGGFEGYAEVITVGRASSSNMGWDGQRMGPWADQLDGADVVINLVGASIQLPWTETNKIEIVDSRVNSTSIIAQAIQGCNKPPRVWLNASATGFYGDRAEEELDENSAAGSGFLSDTCMRWEESLFSPRLEATARIALRFGIVLGSSGGAFPKLWNMTRCFLGGCLGSGAHYQPWIHIDDLVGVVLFAAQRAEEGVVNVVAPQVLRNREWMETMRKVARRPYCPPVPEFMLRILGRTVGPDPEVLLSSQKVTSNATKRFGYAFSHPTFESAIIDLAKVQAR